MCAAIERALPHEFVKSLWLLAGLPTGIAALLRACGSAILYGLWVEPQRHRNGGHRTMIVLTVAAILVGITAAMFGLAFGLIGLVELLARVDGAR